MLEENNLSISIGDFIKYENCGEMLVIQELLSRRSTLSKKVSSTKTLEQVLASNIDHVFICLSTQKTVKLSVLERYLFSFAKQEYEITLLLTKADFDKEISNQNLKIISKTYP